MKLTIDDELYAEYRLFAVLKNVETDDAIRYALSDWFEHYGEPDVEALMPGEEELSDHWLREEVDENGADGAGSSVRWGSSFNLDLVAILLQNNPYKLARVRTPVFEKSC